MRIVCVGGGPAGLYFALLMKKADPANDITVLERNRSDDTFGFGVVFSDATLERFAEADPESHQTIVRSFAHWDDVDVHYQGQVLTSTGHGFCGLARQRLLDILQGRCVELGVDLRFQTDMTDLSAWADTWRRAGLAEASEDDTLAFAQELFARELEGHHLLENRSLWRSFPTVRNARWSHGNVVLGRGRRPHRALLDRLRHQARDRGLDRAGPGPPRAR